MTAKYEWVDATGLRHPSLIYLDITEVEEELSWPFEHTLEHARIIKVKQIDSFDDVFSGGRLDRRKVRVKGMQFVWHHKVMNREYYALFVAFVRKEVSSNEEMRIADSHRSCWICGVPFKVGDGMTVANTAQGNKLMHSRCYAQQTEGGNDDA